MLSYPGLCTYDGVTSRVVAGVLQQWAWRRRWFFGYLGNPPPQFPRPLGCLSTRPGQLCAGLADGGRFCTRTLKHTHTHTHTLFFFITSDLERIPQAFAEINRTARKLRSAYGWLCSSFLLGMRCRLYQIEF